MQIAGMETVKLDSPIEETLHAIAQALKKRVQDVVVMMLDRPRHKRWWRRFGAWALRCG
jgi:fructose-1,6-bisphosphatase/sedoheptulose 1,7-bisphosphatase-like protein